MVRFICYLVYNSLEKNNITVKLMKQNIINNITAFIELLKSPKNNNFSLRKSLHLKYTFVPILLVILFAFYYIDTPVESYMQHSLSRSGSVEMFFQSITNIGKAIYVISVCIVIVVLRLLISIDNISQKMAKLYSIITICAVFVLSSVIISGVIAQIIKMIIGRGRPKFFEQFGSHYFHHFSLPGYDFASMPSGHATTDGAMLIALLFIFPRFKYLWLIALIILAASRVFVFAHYPSDVIFGAALGGYTSAYIYYWMKNRGLIK